MPNYGISQSIDPSDGSNYGYMRFAYTFSETVTVESVFILFSTVTTSANNYLEASDLRVIISDSYSTAASMLDLTSFGSGFFDVSIETDELWVEIRNTGAYA